VILDLLPGGFGTNIMSSTGGIIVDFSSSTNNKDTFMVRGTAAVENLKFAKVAADSNVYIEMTGDKNADIKIIPPTMTGTLGLTASLGAGADILTGSPVVGASADITGFPNVSGTATPLAITTAVMSNAITAYGGAGADTFTGGLGADTFYGGDDNDLFKMAAVTDGADIYSGDLGIDTVDYSTRVLAGDTQNIDIGPATPSMKGTVDLATLDYAAMGDIDTLDLVFSLDGDADVTATFAVATDTNPTAVVAAINAAALAANAAKAVVASLNGKNQLVLATPTALATAGSSFQLQASTAAIALGLTPGAAVTTIADADDGLAGENDDVRSSTENITGGAGIDTIVGDSAKNILLGGLNNDIISGGANTTCASVADGDVLTGGGDDDTFYAATFNCWAAINGGTGADTVKYDARVAALSLSNDGAALDGDTNEKNNISTDIETIYGGYGIDTMTGGANNDTLIGGEGADIMRGGLLNDTLTGGIGNDVMSGEAGEDIMNGGAGDDTMNGGLGTDDIVDYSSYLLAEPATVTLCVAVSTLFGAPTTGAEAGLTTCLAGNDGFGESDQVLNVEHVKGGAGPDVMTASAFGTVGVTFEGNGGDDILTGGPNGDVLWGDGGDDTLNGAAGDDTLDGVAGDDELIGGTGDGDICVPDAADVTDVPVECELL